MELKQAYGLLVMAAENFRGTKQDHINLELAVKTVGAALEPLVAAASQPAQELKQDEHPPV